VVGTVLVGSCAPLHLLQAEIKGTWSAACRLVNIAHSWFFLPFNFNDSCLSEDRPLALTGSQPVEFDASFSFDNLTESYSILPCRIFKKNLKHLESGQNHLDFAICQETLLGHSRPRAP
jgi:hypothetical protein